jgi:hypothetical protein
MRLFGGPAVFHDENCGNQSGSLRSDGGAVSPIHARVVRGRVPVRMPARKGPSDDPS